MGSSTLIGTGEVVLESMREENGWPFYVVLSSFYLEGGGTYDMLESIGERTRLDAVPRNCQHWGTPSTSPNIGDHDVSRSSND